MIKCKLCGNYYKFITDKHLRSKHNWSVNKYRKKFGKKATDHFSILPNTLEKDDIRYIRWRESLKKRPDPWNKGLLKENHPSLLKISKTFKKRKIDNFASWRKKMIQEGNIIVNYPALARNENLAELIGVILGDGNIHKFPRTENLRIYSNSNNSGFINRYSNLVKDIFNKEPRVSKKKNSNCVDISIYQKEISKRLKIPVGARNLSQIKIPQWIWKNQNCLISYLRGLYEAEGSFSTHKPTYTYKFIFTNYNKSLLDNVYKSLIKLGFNPHRSTNKIQRTPLFPDCKFRYFERTNHRCPYCLESVLYFKWDILYGYDIEWVFGLSNKVVTHIKTDLIFSSSSNQRRI